MKIIIASDNENKVREFKLLLEPLNFEIISKKEAGINIEIQETGTSFEENAKIKAKAIFNISSTPTIADDSGLEVFALNKRPGIFSARYSAKDGEPATDEKNNIKLLKEMENVKDRSAQYVCALCFVNSSGKTYSIVETVKGKISTSLQGDNGFGYDPLFLYNNISFANLDSKVKNKISHRGKATKKLLEKIKLWV